MKQINATITKQKPLPDNKPTEHSVTVIIDGRAIKLTREQEALIRSWASGPV